MSGLGLFLGLALIILIMGSVLVFLHSRKILREAKNYERGLKMVPLLIHLPPASEDTDVGGRDVRDVTEENISKAQILYNVLASTLKKGFKSRFYGQRHIGLEIVANRGFVHFYAAVPAAMVSVVQQAMVSAYPTARLEEVPEHNIFSPLGKISGTTGGELVLKEKFAYPISTYEEIKRDAMQSLLNALSMLDKEDGAGIQILLRPAQPGWRKVATTLAGKKRKGNETKKPAEMVLSILKDVGSAAFKGADSGNEKKEPKELSGLEQSVISAIEDKTRHPGYEVLIRIVASSNLLQRSEAVRNNIVAAFSLFDAPGKNGFKYVPAKDIESFATAYIMRFFPPEHRSTILNSVELSTIFHFPDQRSIPTSQLERQASKQVDGPRNIPDEGLLLGYNVFRGVKKKIMLSSNDRRRHMYIVGQTGTGKSQLLENLALQDMLAGNGFAFIDPHGDTAEKLLEMVPKERTEDIVYFSPADMDYPLGLNLFEFHNPDQKDFLIQETINMLYKLYDPNRQGIMGPRYEHLFRNAALTVMSDPQGGAFVDIPKLFNDPGYLQSKLKHVTDTTVIDFWTKEIPGSQRSNEFGEVKSWFVSKFGAFLSNQMMRNIIGQTKSAFDLREIMDNKKILLVNLSKGRTGELNSKLLGMIFVMKFQAAAMSRANIPEDQRVDFSLYVDEFQNFSTDSFATILSEARKYHLNLIVANQFTTQLTDEIRDAVFGNVGSVISFRVGTADAEFLVKKFAPTFDLEDLIRLPNYNTITQIIVGGVPSSPFSMATLPQLGRPNKDLGDALKQLSAAKFGRPKAVVESEFVKRSSSPAPMGPQRPGMPPGMMPPAGYPPTPAAPGVPMSPPGAFPRPPQPYAYPQAPQTAMPPQPPAQTAPQPPSSGSPFLDDWLTKRTVPPPAGAPRPFSQPSVAPPAVAPAPVASPPNPALSTPVAPPPAPAASPTPTPSPAPTVPPPPPAPLAPPEPPKPVVPLVPIPKPDPEPPKEAPAEPEEPKPQEAKPDKPSTHKKEKHEHHEQTREKHRERLEHAAMDADEATVKPEAKEPAEADKPESPKPWPAAEKPMPTQFNAKPVGEESAGTPTSELPMPTSNTVSEHTTDLVVGDEATINIDSEGNLTVGRQKKPAPDNKV